MVDGVTELFACRFSLNCWKGDVEVSNCNCEFDYFFFYFSDFSLQNFHLHCLLYALLGIYVFLVYWLFYHCYIPVCNWGFSLLWNTLSAINIGLLLAFVFRFYLFIWKKESTSQRERPSERDKLSPHWAGRPMWGPIPGSWHHNPSWRQMLNWLSHPGALLPSLVSVCIVYLVSFFFCQPVHIIMFEVSFFMWHLIESFLNICSACLYLLMDVFRLCNVLLIIRA